MAQLIGLDGKPLHTDGFVNMLTKYGTSQDSSTAYRYAAEGLIPDLTLSEHYESDGLFSKIIDAPAEEAVKHGYSLGLKSPDVEDFISDAFDTLDWEGKFATAIKWSRLYGGAIIVMLIDDGGDLNEPLNWKSIRDIDELLVYERSVVQPDYSSMYNYNPGNPLKRTRSKFGMPKYYDVNSAYGSFRVHESRCLVFKNGILPEMITQQAYRYWGMPEYARIKNQLQEAMTSHGLGVKLLERSVQAVYSMQGLSQMLSTDEGENDVLKRLQVIDKARSILNTISIDNDGESYEFKSATMTGVKDIIDSTCNMLSAVTNVPQTLLFGRSPAGENSTGSSDLENYYNYVERAYIKPSVRPNTKTLIDVIIRAGLASGRLDEEPDYKLEFNPLWSMSETEQATVEQTKAATQQTKAATAQIYVDMGALDPSEVRAALAKQEEFSVEEMLDDVPEGELWAEEGTPETKGEEQGTAEEIGEGGEETPNPKTPSVAADGTNGTVGVIVTEYCTILVGKRKDNGQWCGAGGHIEDGETPEQAARRELTEEFGLIAKELKPLGQLTGLDKQYGSPYIFLCEDFDRNRGKTDGEITETMWADDDFLEALDLFPPFDESLKLLEPQGVEGNNNLTIDEKNVIIKEQANDGGPGSGPRPGSGSDYSASGANPKLPGMTGKNLNKHFGSGGRSDHSKQYKNLDKAGYAKRAEELARSAIGGAIEGYKGSDGSIVRYDTSSKDFVKAYDSGVATMFKPKREYEYFAEQMKIDGGVT